MTELARALHDAHGGHGSPRHLPRPLLRILSVLARPISPAFARQNQTALAMDTGLLTVDAPDEPRVLRISAALSALLAQRIERLGLGPGD